MTRDSASSRPESGTGSGGAGPSEAAGTGKPTLQDLGIDPADQHWRGSGGDGGIEVAIVEPIRNAAEWVLVRVAGDPASRVLVYDRHEWECFLDGVRHGEFDAAS